MKVPVLPPKIPIYINNGFGRDTYISSYNGGFGSYKYSKSYKKDYYHIPIHRNHPDLFKRRPIDRYQMTGEGREFFIYKGIQSEHDKGSNNNSFEKCLRKGDSPVEYITSKKMPRNKFEKKLINRIFYGKCPELKDRQMRPKVRFKKDIEKEKEKENEEINNKENPALKTKENCFSNNISLRNALLKTSNTSGKDSIFNFKKTKNNRQFELMLTPLNTNRIKKLNDNKSIYNTNQSDNLISSVKKIFLYNSKNRFDTEFI